MTNHVSSIMIMILKPQSTNEVFESGYNKSDMGDIQFLHDTTRM